MKHFLLYVYAFIFFILLFYFLKQAIKDAVNAPKDSSINKKLDEIILEQKKTNYYLKITAAKTLNLPKGSESSLENDFYKTLDNEPKKDAK